MVFVAFGTGFGAPIIVAMLQRIAGPTAISLLLAGQADLEFRLALEDAGVVALQLSEPLMDDSRAPFRLDPHLLTSTRPRPRLVLRRSHRSVKFDERSKVLSPQSFKLLLFMLMEAQAGLPLIDNRRIEDELWGAAIHGRRVGDAIRRLRDALAPVLGDRGQGHELIQNRPGSYFINQDFAPLEII